MEPSFGDVAGHLGLLLDGLLSLDQFSRWLADEVPRIEADGDDDLIGFASLVENRLAERSGGHINDALLLTALREDMRLWERT